MNKEKEGYDEVANRASSHTRRPIASKKVYILSDRSSLTFSSFHVVPKRDVDITELQAPVL